MTYVILETSCRRRMDLIFAIDVGFVQMSSSVRSVNIEASGRGTALVQVTLV